MHLPVRAVCKAAEVRRDNTAIIGIQYCFSSDKRVKLDSGIAVPPKYWNSKKQCIFDSLPKTFGICTALNKQLSDEIRKAEDIISLGLQLNEHPLEFLKKYYKPNQTIAAILNEVESNKRQEILNDINLNKNIYFQIDNYIKVKTPYNPDLVNQLKQVDLKELDADGCVLVDVAVLTLA